MEKGNIASQLNQGKTAMFGIVILALGIGIGRFLYTPLLPVMLAEGLLSFDQLSTVASANYAGYLAGSLFFSFGRLASTSRISLMLYSAAIITSLLIFAMALTTNFLLVMAIRFAAGVASAAMMIFGSIIILQRTQNPRIIASLYAGVGAGILLGNEYVSLGLKHTLNATGLWWGASFLSVTLLLLLFVLAPRDIDESHQRVAPLTPLKYENITWWQLALLYGLSGLGYIIVATYLPLMVSSLSFPLLTDHLWSLVGLSIIPGCFAWLWAAQRWSTLRCLMINLLIQGSCVLLTLLDSFPILLVLSCIGFGATFMGTTSLVMPLARRLHAPHGINMLGLVTLTYGIGQVLGPLLTSLLLSDSNNIAPAIVCGALSLFVAASICQRQLCATTR